MPKLFLTDLTIRKLKPTDTQVDYFDTKTRGLAARVSRRGTITFIVFYRVGKLNRRMTIARYPEVKPAEARKIANEAMSQVAKGIDPQNEKQEARERYADRLFSTVVEEFLENHARRNTRSWKEPERILKKEFARRWRKLPLDQITRHTISSVLDEIYRINGPSAANHAFSSIRGLFNWCIERGHLNHSPCAGIKAPSKLVERERVPNDSELADVYEAAGKMGYPFGHLVKLLTLTGQRRTDVSGLQWDDLDLTEKTWTQPARSNKSGRLHIVPLNAQSLEILTAIPRLHEALVFTARGKDRPISGFSKWKRELDQISGVRDWTLHDLRRTAATRMASLKVPLHVVELILNHRSRQLSGVAGVYNRHEYLDEQRHALELWGEHVEQLVRKAEAAEPTPIEIAALSEC